MLAKVPCPQNLCMTRTSYTSERARKNLGSKQLEQARIKLGVVWNKADCPKEPKKSTLSKGACSQDLCMLAAWRVLAQCTQQRQPQQ